MLAVPMLRDTQVIGAITVTRKETGGFSGKEVELLKTFASQAVIAIENSRLFNELESRNRELAELLEQQTATSDILRVISTSQRDVQPVFEAIAASALTLCDAVNAGVHTFDGKLIYHVAHAMNADLSQAARTAMVDALRKTFPMPARGPAATAQAIRTRNVAYIRDVQLDARYSANETLRQLISRSVVSVPMLREGEPIGAITLGGNAPNGFTERQISQLKTFADQAVIAIENARLFSETKEALERETATAEILKVISESPTDVTPVFEAIAERARVLCRARVGITTRYDGKQLELIGADIDPSVPADERAKIRAGFSAKLARGSMSSRVVLAKAPVKISDVRLDEEYPYREAAQTVGYRSVLGVPLLLSGEVIGTVVVSGENQEMFTDKFVALLQTFADQAVIAIQNTRLFNELQSRTQELAHSVEQLRSLSEIGQAVNSTLDLEEVLSKIVKNAVQLSGAEGGAVFEANDGEVGGFRLQATYGLSKGIVDMMRQTPLRAGEGATGRAAETRAPVQIPDLQMDPEYSGRLRRVMDQAGFGSLLAVPLLREGRVLGSLAVFRKQPGEFASEVIEMLQTFAAQSTLAIQNARLFREIAQKSAELEIASQHKSQFLANMSHELRTPLNAILGYTELINDGIYGEVPEKISEVMERVQASGRHLLGLINDVLDLSKIEAGQLKLSVNEYSFNDIVQSVISGVESLAAEKKLKLTTDLAPDLPTGRGDERRVAQVLMNLVGNAIKFTDKGEVAVSVTAPESIFLASVRDTGPGISAEQQQMIFEEFQQVDSSSTRKKGGTGLGLAIAKRIVELHGGRIWVESVPGKGATFSFSLPVTMPEREAVE
jgi:signal transduction histidine kinase